MTFARKIIAPGAAVIALFLVGCAGLPTKKETGLEAIPPVPAGFQPLPSTSTGFRSAKIQQGNQIWVVTFEDAIIKVSPFPYNVRKLTPRWYPEEGGADAALCRGYQRGNEVMIRLEGSSDVVTEETRVFFKDNRMREVIKYSLPGQGMGPEMPGRKVPYKDRVKRQLF